jgi:hypothetical protein
MSADLPSPALSAGARGYVLPLDYSGASELSGAGGGVGGVFDSAWRARCRVKVCSIAAVESFIQAHYLRKRPAIVLLCLMMLDGQRPVGCVIYSAPPREADKRYGGKTWELARLYLLDEVPKNAETWLIGRSVRHIARNHRDVCYLLSYADPSAGHAGTIYKAANWTADGRSDEERKTARCDYYDARTGKKYGRRGNMPTDAVIERRPRVSKHRFVYPMVRRAAGAGVWGIRAATEPKRHNVSSSAATPGERSTDVR